MKRIFLKNVFLVFIMSAAMMLAEVSANSAEATGKCGDNLTWSYENDVLTISGSGAMYDYDFFDDNNQAPWVSYLGDDSSQPPKSVVLPEGITYIGKSAFMYANIADINIPETVTAIGEDALFFTSIKNISIPKSVTSIGRDGVCSLLCESITVADDNPEYSSLDGVLFDKKRETIITYPCSKTDSVYIIPDTVKTIASSAFYSNYNLKELYIPETVTTVEYAGINISRLKCYVFKDSAAEKYIIDYNSFMEDYPITYEYITSMPDTKPNTGAVSVSIANVSGKPGGIVEVDVVLSGNKGFASLGIEIGYDEKILTLKNVITNSQVDAMVTAAQYITANPYNMQWDNSSSGGSSFNGTIATLEFEINANAPVGETPITVSYYKGRNGNYTDGESVNYDAEYHSLNLSYVNGKVTVSDGAAPTPTPLPTPAPTPTPTPEPQADITNVKLTDNDGKLKITAQGENIPEYASVYAALYKDDMLLSVKKMNELEAEFDNCDFDYVKVFCWNIKNMQPLCKAYTKTQIAVQGKWLLGQNSPTNAYIDNGIIYYGFISQPYIYVYDGINTKTYAAGGTPHGIVVYEDKIYYINKNNNTICRMDTQTGAREVIFDKQFSDVNGMYINKGKMLITGYEDDVQRVYTMELASNKTELLYTREDASKTSIYTYINGKLAMQSLKSSYAFWGNYLFVFEGTSKTDDGKTEYKIHKLDLNTGKSEQAINVEGTVSDDAGYSHWYNGASAKYDNEYAYFKLYFLNTKGSSAKSVTKCFKINLSDGITQEISEAEYNNAKNLNSNAVDGWIYGTDGAGNICRQNVETGTIETLLSGTDYYYITNDDKYVVALRAKLKSGGSSASPDGFEYAELYIINTDGNNKKMINSKNGTSGGGGNSGTEETDCTKCGGTGLITCTVCGGSKGHYITMLGQQVWQGCVTCGGTGQMLCPECGGSGKK